MTFVQNRVKAHNEAEAVEKIYNRHPDLIGAPSVSYVMPCADDEYWYEYVVEIESEFICMG